MEEGLPESTIQVAVPSYPAEFGNEAYRIAETMEAADPSYQTAASADDYYNAADVQHQSHPQQYAHRSGTLAQP